MKTIKCHKCILKLTHDIIRRYNKYLLKEKIVYNNLNNKILELVFMHLQNYLKKCFLANLVDLVKQQMVL